MRGLTLAAFAAMLLAGPAAAQQAPLDRAEASIAAGDYAAARAAVDEWWRAFDRGGEAPVQERVRARVLRARLSADPAAAQEDYLAVALGHPTSPEAPQALLLLGQGLLASGDVYRAASYLQRLINDYPDSPARPTGLLWLARARRLGGDAAQACALARQGLHVGDADLAALFRSEADAACPREPAATPPAAPTGRFAVQSGAFRQESGAHALAEQLRAAGYEPRLVRVPRSALLRVRIGRFPTAGEAARLASRLRSAGFDAVVVNDAHQELPEQ